MRGAQVKRELSPLVLSHDQRLCVGCPAQVAHFVRYVSHLLPPPSVQVWIVF